MQMGVLLSNPETIEEKKAKILMSLRGYRQIRRKKHKEGISFVIKTGEGKEALLFAWPTQGTVGIQILNQLKKIMKDEKMERAILVTSGRFTQAAKTQARKKHVELIPRIFPSFNIFEHALVPKHEIVPAEERQKLLDEYRVQPYQLPRLLSSDPAVKVIGARPGDIVRVIRNSPTAGKYISYRYVVEG